MTDTLTAVKTTIPHVIAGARVDDDARRGPVFNPATGEQTAEVVLADAARIDEAVAAASAAQIAWRNTGLGRRSHVMFKLREIIERREVELARLITSEHGKTVDDALGEVARGLEKSSSAPASCTT